ncbi:hypothetical protein L2K70_06600 [Nocardioides KLBMP 9356]|uniref:Peptidase MA-like domain-containing protein n=1 Tax=Nocardioides potassii TaxID=2911371 RepID=A0ABS9H7R5_9ACTN|nr:hypothetical protein [Nocardioides potassii]MCF6377267.1 hypothetical protein [Nocardioides potassii]
MAVVVAAVLVVQRGDRHDVDPRPVDVPRASPADAASTLDALVAGIDARDATALADLATPGDAAAADVLRGIAATAGSVQLEDVSVRYVDQAGAVAEDGTWSAVAEVAWSVAGDAVPSRADVVVRFAPRGDGRLAIAGFGGGDTARLPLWLRGELSVARAPGVLVMADGPQAEADAVAVRVTRGRSVVRQVLPGWRSPVVVEVPASAADLDETLGATPGTYAGIAAVTATAGTSDTVDAPVHVFVNPQVSGGLRPAGAQVVMSHELVHVATDAVHRPVEPWLSEGFADYVALRDTRLPDRTTSGRAIAAVRAAGLPQELPGAADFDTRAQQLQARYEEAWLACRVIAERVGEQGLLSVYDDARSGRPLDEALAQAGLSQQDLVRLWRARLQRLAR